MKRKTRHLRCHRTPVVAAVQVVILGFELLYFYLRPVFWTRPKGERRELYAAIVFGVSVFSGVAYAGWTEYYVLLRFRRESRPCFWRSLLITCPITRTKRK